MSGAKSATRPRYSSSAATNAAPPPNGGQPVLCDQNPSVWLPQPSRVLCGRVGYHELWHPSGFVDRFQFGTGRKRVEKLRYIHRNPVHRGLCEHPEDWKWSSFLAWVTGAEGPVEIEFPSAARIEKETE